LKNQKENRGEAETRKGAQPAEDAYEIASKAEVRNRFFCFNNPVNLMDPEGLCAVKWMRNQIHEILAVAGMIPVLGAVPDLLDSLIYAAEGDFYQAAFAIGCAVPGAGDALRGLQFASKGLKYADKSGLLNTFKKLIMNNRGAIGDVKNAAKGVTELSANALVKPSLTFGKHTLEQMADRKISTKMVEVALDKGKRFWDPKNKTVNYVLEEGFASGKDLLVGRNPVTGKITTVIRGNDLVVPRFVPLD
jgi:hypothetical protein